MGLAVGQSAILGLLISGFYKAFTGRIQPPGHSLMAISSNNLVDISRDFQFGFLRHGVYWGWPSTHATLAFAISAAFWTLFPENKIIRFLALIYAFYVGIGVAITSIHWFSEFVAGAIIGSVIGITVGKSYLAGVEEKVGI